MCDQYRCDCDPGYNQNELDECCEELNQCEQGIPSLGVAPEYVCAPNFFCVNSCTGFDCICGDGFTEENGNCVPEADTTVMETTTSAGQETTIATQEKASNKIDKAILSGHVSATRVNSLLIGWKSRGCDLL